MGVAPMKSRLFARATLIAAFCGLSSGVGGAARGDDKDAVVKVRIFTPRILVRDKDKVKEVNRALEKLPSVKIIPHSDSTPHYLIEFNTTKVELGDLAKAIASIEDESAKDETAAFLMFDAKYTKAQQDGLLKALGKVKGVVANKSEVGDERTRIALDNNGEAKLADVIKAIRSVAPTK
jgi:hypothetical protein